MPLYKLQSRVVVYLHLHKIKQTNERRKHKIQTAQVRPRYPTGLLKSSQLEKITFKEKADPANTENSLNVC